MFILSIASLIGNQIIRFTTVTIIFFISLILSYNGIMTLSGLPQSVNLMITKPQVKEATVIGYVIDESIGIFLLLSAPELGPIPKYYWYPYTTKMAENIEKAERGTKSNGQDNGTEQKGLRVKNPFSNKSMEDRDLDGIEFYPPPQSRTLPNKDNGPPALRFNREG